MTDPAVFPLGSDAPVSDDARQAIEDGLSCDPEPKGGPGLPIGWEGVEVVEP